MKSSLKMFAACLVTMMFSLSVYAECTPVLVLIRHAEDYTKKVGLDEFGVLHAQAYANLFSEDLSGVKFTNENLCPIKTILSFEHAEPQATVAPTAAKIGINVDNYVFPVVLTDPQGSTLLVLNRQTMWGDNPSAPSSNSFLGKIIGNDISLLNMISKTGTPRFNYLYIFKTLTHPTLNDVAVYLQLYDTGNGKEICRARLEKTDFDGNPTSLKIIRLDQFTDKSEISERDSCTWSD